MDLPEAPEIDFCLRLSWQWVIVRFLLLFVYDVARCNFVHIASAILEGLTCSQHPLVWRNNDGEFFNTTYLGKVFDAVVCSTRTKETLLQIQQPLRTVWLRRQLYTRSMGFGTIFWGHRAINKGRICL